MRGMWDETKIKQKTTLCKVEVPAACLRGPMVGAEQTGFREVYGSFERISQMWLSHICKEMRYMRGFLPDASRAWEDLKGDLGVDSFTHCYGEIRWEDMSPGTRGPFSLDYI